MYSIQQLQHSSNAVAQLLQTDPATSVSALAASLNISESQVAQSLPAEMATHIDGKQAQTVLEQLPDWGKVTTIIIAAGSIFESKASFPKGKIARGYYNLMGREGQLHGHLKLDNIKHIAFISKPFMGMESHHIAFYDEAGDNIFKVYLGRDQKRVLIPEQIERFNQMKEALAQ